MKSIQTLFASRNFRLLSLFAIVALFFTFSAEAQSIGAGLAQAANELRQYVTPVKHICYGLAALVFLLGGISIFIKMSNGDQDVKSSIMMLVGGVVFLLIVGTLADTLFTP